MNTGNLFFTAPKETTLVQVQTQFAISYLCDCSQSSSSFCVSYLDQK